MLSSAVSLFAGSAGYAHGAGAALTQTAGRSAVRSANYCAAARSMGINCVATSVVDTLETQLRSQRLLNTGADAASRVRELMEADGFQFSTTAHARPPAAESTAAPAKAEAAAEPAPAKKGKDKKKGSGPPPAANLGTPLVIGLSHKTATVEVREKLSIQEHVWNEASQALCAFDSIREAAVLSTCNRFEVYIVAEDHYAATRDVMTYLKGHSGLGDAELRPNLFMLLESDAVWHLLRVASGLDSLVIGEGQILSQVKACYSHAIATGPEEGEEDAEGAEPAGSAGKVLGRLLNTAVMSGKSVRSETGIAQGAVSISSAAVELAVLKAQADLGKPLSEVRVTIIGAGKMSRLLITHLASHGVTKLTLLNRSRPRADEMAAEYPDLDIRVGLMDELWETMEASDLAFTSTSATGCIITEPLLAERVWGQTGQPLVIIDISVPRNVEAECNEVEGVRAYNVDDLKEVVARNQARRRHKVIEAEVLLRGELSKFEAWQESLQYVPTISRLQARFEKVRAAEVAKAQKKALKGLSDKERQAVETLTKGVINKLLHAPMSYLRSDAEGDKATVRQIDELFQLD